LNGNKFIRRNSIWAQLVISLYSHTI
jgi:hypothetical protein